MKSKGVVVSCSRPSSSSRGGFIEEESLGQGGDVSRGAVRHLHTPLRYSTRSRVYQWVSYSEQIVIHSDSKESDYTGEVANILTGKKRHISNECGSKNWF